MPLQNQQIQELNLSLRERSRACTREGAQTKEHPLSGGNIFVRSMDIVVMVILGGMGSTYGVIFAAILLTILPEALREFSEYRMIIYSLLLIILMISVILEIVMICRRKYIHASATYALSDGLRAICSCVAVLTF